MPPSDAIDDTAIAWLLRLRAPDAGGPDWAAFTDWLAADPRHAAAYDAVALADSDAAAALPAAPRPEPAPMPLRRPWRGRALIAAGSIAAALAVIVPAAISQRRPADQTVTTAPGERRSVALPDGTQISLNGATKLVIGDRRAVLAEGEALFTVKHDPDAPFEVRAGTMRLRDLGTMFNVKRAAGGVTEVAVAEGAVIADPDGAALRLSPGDRLRAPDGGGRAVLSHLPVAAIGGWRDGRLSFTDAAIADVAADLGRGTGLSIVADPQIAGRRFTGTIVVDGDRDALRRRLPQLLDVAVAGEGDRWQLNPPARQR